MSSNDLEKLAQNLEFEENEVKALQVVLTGKETIEHYIETKSKMVDYLKARLAKELCR